MFRDLARLQDRMNRLFEESLPRTRSEREDFFLGGNWAPAVDIFEEENSIVLKADLPDIDPNDLDIRIEDNILFLKGERKFQKEIKEENFHRMERMYGSFSRSFVLPHTVSADKIQADYKNGVLQVTMPKREEARPKQIKINIGEGLERKKQETTIKK